MRTASRPGGTHAVCVVSATLDFPPSDIVEPSRLPPEPLAGFTPQGASGFGHKELKGPKAGAMTAPSAIRPGVADTQWRMTGPLISTLVPALVAGFVHQDKAREPALSLAMHDDVQALSHSLGVMLGRDARDWQGSAQAGALAATAFDSIRLSRSCSARAMDFANFLMNTRPAGEREQMAVDMAVASIIANLPVLAGLVYLPAQIDTLMRGAQGMLAYIMRPWLPEDLLRKPLTEQIGLARKFMNTPRGQALGKQFSQPIEQLGLSVKRLESLVAVKGAYANEGESVVELLDRYVPPGSVNVRPVKWFSDSPPQTPGVPLQAGVGGQVAAGTAQAVAMEQPAVREQAAVAAHAAVAASQAVPPAAGAANPPGRQDAPATVVFVPRPANSLSAGPGRMAPGNFANPREHYHPAGHRAKSSAWVSEVEATNRARSDGRIERFEQLTGGIRHQLLADRAARAGVNTVEELARGQRLVQYVFEMASRS